MEEQIKNVSLPEKSALWIGGNIAGGVMLIVFLVRFIGGIILGLFFSKNNIILSIFFGIILLLIGSYFGSIFGVRYVTKRAKINIEKIKSISIVAAIIPFLLLLLWVGVDIYTSLSGVEKFSFQKQLDSVIGTAIVAIVTFFLVRNSLQKFVESQNQA